MTVKTVYESLKIFEFPFLAIPELLLRLLRFRNLELYDGSINLSFRNNDKTLVVVIDINKQTLKL